MGLPKLAYLIQWKSWIALLCLVLPLLPGSAKGSDLFLNKIDFDIHAVGVERACFSFSAAFSPDLFALEGDRPRIVLDIPGVSRWDGKTEYSVEGSLIRRIRLYLHRNQRKLRIVVDLAPTFHFVVDPVINHNRHFLCLSIRREGTPAGTRRLRQ